MRIGTDTQRRNKLLELSGVGPTRGVPDTLCRWRWRQSEDSGNGQVSIDVGRKVKIEEI